MRHTGLVASVVGLTLMAGCGGVSGQPAGEISAPPSGAVVEERNGCEQIDLPLPEGADPDSQKSADLVCR